MTDLNLLIAASFLGVLAIVLGAYWVLVVIPERRGQGAVRRRLKWEAPDQVASSTQLLKKQQVLSTIGSLDVMLKRAEGISGPQNYRIRASFGGLE